MNIPMEITFRDDVDKTQELEDLTHEEAQKLERVSDRIMGCRVAVERPHRHPQQGNPYRVRLDITVPPNHEVVVTREPGDNEMHTPLHAVIRDSFSAARRKLQKLVEIQRREVKSHPEQEAAAVITRLYKEDGYGFLKTLDGRDIYFHRNSVLHDDFERLEVGTAVRFFEEMGDKGPQASTVQVIDTRGTSHPEAEVLKPPLGWERKKE